MDELKELKNTCKGERCFILGNGPSILDHDLDKLIDEHTFTVNCFHVHDVWPKLKKVYYFDLCGVSFVGPEDQLLRFQENPDKIYRHIIGINRWKQRELLKNKYAKLFFNEMYRLSVDTYLKRSKEDIFYLTFDRESKVMDGDYNWDIVKDGSSFAATSVIEGPVSVAQYMGFKKIYVIGCDSTPYDGINSYFYDWEKLPLAYWPKTMDNVGYPDMIKSWETISKIFPEHGIDVYNASIRGKLDMFEKVNYDDLF